MNVFRNVEPTIFLIFRSINEPDRFDVGKSIYCILTKHNYIPDFSVMFSKNVPNISKIRS